MKLDPKLIRRYGRPGPRYTSYPTADRFRDGFGEDQVRTWSRPEGGPRPLSLYVHIPFCRRLCFFCGCNKIVTHDRRRITRYVEDVRRELELRAGLCRPDSVVSQLHWGGGTPTYLTDDEIGGLMRALREAFSFAPDDEGEYSIEIDPRQTDPAQIALLRCLGFNRVSLGIQDFDHEVQRAVNRIQPRRMTLDVMRAARREGFRSISVDLIYGLPHQTPYSFDQTLDELLIAAPDRVAVFNYAHLPSVFKAQRCIDPGALPSASERLEILGRTIERLTRSGYVHIGMDHFARMDDELALALAAGTLQRGFQGYSTRGGCDLLALGASAISHAGGLGYSQNTRDVNEYHEMLAAGRLPVVRGVQLDEDDRIRHDVIMSLMCRGGLCFREIEEAHGIDVGRYFAPELAELRCLERDGLVETDDEGVRVTAGGRLLVRTVASVFDRYFERDKGLFSSSV